MKKFLAYFSIFFVIFFYEYSVANEIGIYGIKFDMSYNEVIENGISRGYAVQASYVPVKFKNSVKYDKGYSLNLYFGKPMGVEFNKKYINILDIKDYSDSGIYFLPLSINSDLRGYLESIIKGKYYPLNIKYCINLNRDTSSTIDVTTYFINDNGNIKIFKIDSSSGDMDSYNNFVELFNELYGNPIVSNFIDDSGLHEKYMLWFSNNYRVFLKHVSNRLDEYVGGWERFELEIYQINIYKEMFNFCINNLYNLNNMSNEDKKYFMSKYYKMSTRNNELLNEITAKDEYDEYRIEQENKNRIYEEKMYKERQEMR